MQTTVFFVILALLIFAVLSENALIGFVLGGLLAIVWYFAHRVHTLTQRLTKLEHLIAQTEKSDKTVTVAAPTIASTTTPAPVNNPIEPKPVAAANDSRTLITSNTNVTTSEIISPTPVSSATPTSEANESAPVQKTDDQLASSVADKSSVDSAAVEKSVIERPVIETPTPNRPASTLSQATHARTVPSKPVEPNFIEKAIQYAWNWFTDGNVFVRAGIIILFFGMTFLIRYAVNENWIPIELRLTAVCALAVVLQIWGWRQRIIRRDFSLIVQGGAIGLFYLTIFAGFSFYGVIPASIAFAILAVLVILAAMLAVIQDAKSLALAATIGGFLAPVLTSSGSNNYIGLFSYYALLNMGILGIAWYKSWRILNFVGYIFTFVISTIWGVLSYKAEYFSTTEPFLLFFFLLYVAIGILFAHNRTPFYKDYIDSSIIFGAPLLGFGLQCAMVKEYEYGIAISAAVLGLFYLVLATVLWKKAGERLRLLSETFLSLGVVFATLAIPFAIDGTLTGATWALEGLGILWISIKQQQKYRKLFGVALIFFAGLILAAEVIFPIGVPAPIFNYAFLNSLFIGCLIIAFSACASSWLLSREYVGKQSVDDKLAGQLFLFGLLVLFGGFEYQIVDFSLYSWHGNSLAILCGVCMLIYSQAARRLNWPQVHWASCGFIFPLMAAAILTYAYQDQLSQHYGYIIWPLAILSYFFALKRALNYLPEKVFTGAHIFIGLTITCLLYWEGLWQLLLGYSLLAIMFNVLGKKYQWPQLKLLALGFLPVLVICSIGAILIDGDLISLSSNAADVQWPFPPGYLLWPFGFTVYFYLLHQNPLIAGRSTRNLHHAGAALIGCLLLWLGLWPLLLGASLLCLLATILWRSLDWPEMRSTALALLPLMLLVAFIKLVDNNFDPFYLQDFNLALKISWEMGYVLWPLSMAVVFGTLYLCDRHNQPAPPALHSLAILLPIALITWEVSWHLLDYVDLKNAWHLAWLPLMSMLGILFILKPVFWPFTTHKNHHQKNTLWPLTLVLIGFSFFQLTSSGASEPLPWIPFINAIDIVQCIILIGYWRWSDLLFSSFYQTPSTKRTTLIGLAYMFLWANVELLRAIHHWADVAWQVPQIITADISQTTLSLFWALSGLAATMYASKKQQRSLWIIGATLLGVVVIKLFLVDLSARDTVERIVSFTGVGLLLVLVGYFSPLPPKHNTEASKLDEE